MNKIALWKSLNEGEKLCLLWYNWILYDYKNTNNPQTYIRFSVFMVFIIGYLAAKNVPVDCCPIIDFDNFVTMHIRVNKRLDTDSLLELNLIDDYKILFSGRKWRVIAK